MRLFGLLASVMLPSLLRVYVVYEISLIGRRQRYRARQTVADVGRQGAHAPVRLEGHDLKFNFFDGEKNLPPLACLGEFQMTPKT